MSITTEQEDLARAYRQAYWDTAQTRTPLQEAHVFDTVPVNTVPIALHGGNDRATRPEIRSWRERRAGRKRYARAQRMYGKTYIVTRNQLLSGVAAMVGSALILAAGLSYWYMIMLEAAGAFVK